MNKFLAALILFFGEFISIVAEIYAAKYFAIEHNSFKTVFWRLIPVIVLGSILLLVGYMFSMSKFKNIWIVSVISIVSILISEPILNYIITKQSPGRGALIGFVLGLLGLLAALFL